MQLWQDNKNPQHNQQFPERHRLHNNVLVKQSVMRALTSSYAGRKQRKRQFRQLWIARINAATRMNGLSYSKFMHGLKLAGVDINRKMLSEMAISEPEAFKALVDVAKEKLSLINRINIVKTS